MDLGDFLKFRDEVCSNFLKNSKVASIVLYGASFATLNFLSNTMKEYFEDKGEKIEIVIDDKTEKNFIKEKYSEKYLINVYSLLQNSQRD
ncbi:Uncharacterised protein [uncultured archaeon]|nr:Uncharacterised protein [uncultured archaeon]